MVSFKSYQSYLMLMRLSTLARFFPELRVTIDDLELTYADAGSRDILGDYNQRDRPADSYGVFRME